MKIKIIKKEKNTEKPKAKSGRGKDSRRYPPTLCFSCATEENNGCSWSSKHIPVKGWEAEETKIGGIDSFFIKKCPLYVPTLEKIKSMIQTEEEKNEKDKS